MTEPKLQTHMRLSPSRTVQAARMLITDVQLWTQHARARDAWGRRCKPNSLRATQWSMNGALAVVSNPHGIAPPYLLRRLDRLAIELGMVTCLFPEPYDEWKDGCFEIWESCDDFNDYRTHADVLNLMDTVALGLQEVGL